MNDAQSTIVGLNAQDCPGGGWNGMPSELERATVADCLAHGVCGCIYGDAVQHIERLRADNVNLRAAVETIFTAAKAVRELTRRDEQSQAAHIVTNADARCSICGAAEPDWNAAFVEADKRNVD